MELKKPGWVAAGFFFAIISIGPISPIRPIGPIIKGFL
jgi:hypothetical protein